MAEHPLRDRTAIAGVGRTESVARLGREHAHLALRAIRAALDDAGLTIADVDGVACHRVGDSVQATLVAQSLGIRDLRYHLDLFGGGSQSAWAVGSAAIAVAAGVAECVVVWRSVNARSEFRMGGTGRAAPDTLEFQYQAPYWFATPPQQFAMYARAYLDAYGVTARGPRTRRGQPACVRGAERPRGDAHAPHDGRLPRVAHHRRAVPAVRLLPRDRRRGRGGGHDGRAGARPAAPARPDLRRGTIGPGR